MILMGRSMCARAALLLWVVGVAGGSSGAVRAEPAPVIGSKVFTESVVLAEVARLTARERGVELVHRRELGGSRILFEALRKGEIDVYPEYSGTLVFELLQRSQASWPSEAELERALAALGLVAIAPLGFENTYALGMREETARRLGISRISDLRAHPKLRFGFSSEFMDRKDGWPGLARAYDLEPTWVRGMDHDLAYRALESGDLDVLDLYSTDADIAYYELAVLEDDRGYFPEYRAFYLARADLRERHPGAHAALTALAGRIDARAMIAMNSRVKLERLSEGQAAAEFLGISAPIAQSSRWQRIGRTTGEHLSLVAVSLLAAIVAAIPLGILAARHHRLGGWILGLAGILQTIPSLALFVFMIPVFGIGAAPAIVALFLYSLLPIVRNTHAGLTGIDPALRESALALGLPRSVRLRWIELPLASNSILAGIKTAAVINVGTATLAALIGAGGYGQPILTGIRLDDLGLILEGAIPAALLALAVQGFFAAIEQGLGWRHAPAVQHD